MEPPSKRLRLLQSVPLDETDADLARREQESTLRLKSTWEALFEKYGDENMDQGDEIDLVTGEIVVDRGHIRSMVDEGGGGLAGDANEFFNQMADDLEDYDEDSTDELAMDVPTPKPLKPRAEEVAQTVQEPQALSVQPEPPVSEPPTHEQTEVTSPDHVAMEVARLAQPMTPQAQPDAAAFEALGKAIWGQLSMFMGRYGGGTPMTTPAAAPSTDQRWIAPPLPDTVSRPQTFQYANSSPIVATMNRRQSPRRSIWALPRTRTRKPPTAASTDDESHILPGATPRSSQTRAQEDRIPESKTPLAEASAHTNSTGKRPRRKYVFDVDDDDFLFEQRNEKGLTFPEIRKAREKWKEWPVSILYQRYSKLLKLRKFSPAPDRREDVDAPPESGSVDFCEGEGSHAQSYRNPPVQRNDGVRVEIQVRRSQSPRSRPQQLPTPSTTNRGSQETVAKPPQSATVPEEEPVIRNITDDETDYEVPEELDTTRVVYDSEEPESSDEAVPLRPATISPDEPIESVETVGSPTNPASSPPPIPTEPEPETPTKPLSPPKGKLKSIRKPNRPAPNSTKQTPRNPKPIEIHSKDLAKLKPTPNPVEENDTDPIQVKQESTTPPHPLMISNIPLQTPKTAPQFRTAHLLPSSGGRSSNAGTSVNNTPASGSKSVSKHDKANYLKRVKEQWKNQAKRRRGTPAPVRRKAVGGMGDVRMGKRKAVWLGEGSEDELAM